MIEPAVTIAHLTDTHIRGDDELVHGQVNTLENLRSVLDRLVASGQRIDSIVLSGDLSDDGSPLSYRRLRAAVDPVARELDAHVICAVGNHDDRDAMYTEMFDAGPADDSGRGPYDAVHHVRGLRIVVLDSTTPGRHDGRLEADQLAWLADELSRPNELGTVLIQHHPPIPSPVATVDYLKLATAEHLEAVLLHSDVRMILCGHAHHTGAGAIAGIPVWVGPAMSYRVDPVAPVGRHRGVTGYGFSRIDLIGSSIVATAVEDTVSVPVYDQPQQDVLDKLHALSLGTG
ncbi:Icc protein [Rhodococcus sp. 27YEA15]|uniref:metallophosphoesterase n=1 Tax=Rhodococcus sp. 27YEA15 TaxID=3156259 RepID=UPI003C7EAFFC